jgi:geranylgeranyl pyrophosphate synthase
MSAIVNQLLESALHQPAHEFKRRQGKRIRGSMVQIGFEMAGGKGQVSEAISESIECLHAGSLVIDDVQDESLCRRGEPTLHQVIGVPLAINAGNWMYFRALELLTTTSLPPHQRARLVEAMVTAGRRCHEGQALDLHARIDQLPAAHWHDAVEAISTLKTGVLVELAVTMGCIAAGASTVLHSAMAGFGCQIGVALQMRNDLDELISIANGKSDNGCVRDDDLRHARVTWPWAWAFELAGEKRCLLLACHLDASSRQRQQVAHELLSIVQSHGDEVIAGLIRDQVRLLGEHIVDRRLMERMRECLQPIEQPRERAGIQTIAAKH